MKTCLKVFAAVLLFVSGFSAFANQNHDENHYVIFVDAGSTSSKLHIFHYDKLDSMPVIEDVFSSSVSPGLATADNPGASLQPLLEKAKQFLAGKADTHLVPINVFGTAGMRVLLKDRQKAIYANVTDFLAKQAFAKGEVKTISGTMEGFYGWADVNYLQGNFQNHRTTVGSIDMGGVSTQIAYAVPAQNKQSTHVVTMNVNNQTYTVFSQSFLGLGLDQSFAEMTREPSAGVCYPNGYVIDVNKTGAFNFPNCTRIYHNMIAGYNIPQHLSPDFKGQSFVVYSGIYYVWHFFNIEATPDQASVEKAINAVCYQSWSDLQKAYPAEKVIYLLARCASASYENELLYRTYGLQGYQLSVVSQINKTNIDWTLGAALYSLVK